MTPSLSRRERPADSRTTRSRRQQASIALAIATATAGVLPVFLTGALAVQLEAAFHVGATAIGVSVATFFGSSAACSLRAGRLAERVGPFKVMVIAIALALISLLGIGLVVDSFPSLLAFLVAGGLSNGAMQPAVNLLLSRSVDGHRQGFAFGVKQAAIPTATMLSGFSVPALALTAGWHVAYLAGGALALVVGAVLLTSGRRLVPRPDAPAAGRETDAPLEPGTASASVEPGTGSAPVEPGIASAPVEPGMTSAPVEPSRPAGGNGAAFDPRPLIPLALAMACAVSGSNALGSFVVPGAVHDGVAPGLAGLLSAAGSIVGLTVRVTFGWRADRTGLRGRRAADAHLRTVTTLIAVGALGYAALAVGNLVLLLPAVLIAFGGGWGFNGLFNFAVVSAYPENPARATASTQIGTYIGGMVGPIGFGAVVDHFGFDVGWAICAGLALVAVAAFGVSRRRLLPAPAHRGLAAPATPQIGP